MLVQETSWDLPSLGHGAMASYTVAPNGQGANSLDPKS
jgi:hypothetical protein